MPDIRPIRRADLLLDRPDFLARADDLAAAYEAAARRDPDNVLCAGKAIALGLVVAIGRRNPSSPAPIFDLLNAALQALIFQGDYAFVPWCIARRSLAEWMAMTPNPEPTR